MSWLENRELQAKFRCTCKDEVFTTPYICKDGRPESVLCPNCGSRTEDYVGTMPYKRLNFLKETFEKNGRLGIRVRLPDGTVTHRSKTKEDYLNNGDTRSKLTAEAQRASDSIMATHAAQYVRANTNKVHKNIALAKEYTDEN